MGGVLPAKSGGGGEGAATTGREGWLCPPRLLHPGQPHLQPSDVLSEVCAIVSSEDRVL